jgi:DNA polymerase III subunit delta'
MPADVGGLWDRVVGQEAATTIVRAAVSREEVAHAWLLVGTPGVGQGELVAALAADLNCEQRGEGGAACGACSTCTRIAAGRHPACQTFEPEGAEHVVGSVREAWIPAATRSLVEGRVRVLRIVAADRMNEGAQNAFLKVLEEPPAPVVWVLDAEDPGMLLDTIVSRCRRLDLAPWGPAQLAARADQLGAPAERRDALVAAALGALERLEALIDDVLAAAEAAEDPDADDAATTPARDRHVAMVGRLLDEGPGIAVGLARELDAWAKEQRKRRGARHREELDRLEESFGGEWPPGVKKRVEKRLERLERGERRRALTRALDDIATYLRDLVAVASGASPVNVDHEERIRRDAERLPPRVALVGLDAIREATEALEGQGQPELQLERMFLRLGVEIYRAEI